MSSSVPSSTCTTYPTSPISSAARWPRAPWSGSATASAIDSCGAACQAARDPEGTPLTGAPSALANPPRDSILPTCKQRLHSSPRLLAHLHAPPALPARQVVERLRRIVVQNALAALAEEKRFGALHILEVLRAQHHVACRAAALHHLGHGDSPASLADALILLVGRRGDLFGDTGPLRLQLAGRLAIHCRALASHRLLAFHLRLFFLERCLRRFHVLLQRLAFPHQLQDAVFQPADFLLAEFDLVLEGAVLVVRLGAEHLILELRDLLVLHRNIGFTLLPLFLIGRQRCAVRIELPLVRTQLLLNFSDVFGQGGDFARKFRKTIIDFLQADHQLQVEEHYLPQCNTLLRAPQFHLLVDLLGLLQAGERHARQSCRRGTRRHTPAQRFHPIVLAFHRPCISRRQRVAGADGTHRVHPRRQRLEQTLAKRAHRTPAAQREHHRFRPHRADPLRRLQIVRARQERAPQQTVRLLLIQIGRASCRERV